MNRLSPTANGDDFDSYQIVTDPANRSNNTSSASDLYTPGSRSVHSAKQQQQSPIDGANSDPLVVEVPERIYAVRKGALSVLKPLTNTWVR